MDLLHFARHRRAAFSEGHYQAHLAQLGEPGAHGAVPLAAQRSYLLCNAAGQAGLLYGKVTGASDLFHAV